MSLEANRIQRVLNSLGPLRFSGREDPNNPGHLRDCLKLKAVQRALAKKEIHLHAQVILMDKWPSKFGEHEVTLTLTERDGSDVQLKLSVEVQPAEVDVIDVRDKFRSSQSDWKQFSFTPEEITSIHPSIEIETRWWGGAMRERLYIGGMAVATRYFLRFEGAIEAASYLE